MVKILSQSGNSLADMYDVEGSIAGIEQLETRELPIVHEIGATIFSERLSSTVRRLATTAIAQNTDFNVVISDLPAVPFRVQSVALFSIEAGSRVALAMLALRDAPEGREIPLITFDNGNDVESSIRIVENGAAVATITQLMGRTQVPTLGMGSGQPQSVDEIVLRGTTDGFGAGLITTVGLVHITFAQIAGISSRGVLVPSW